MQQQAALGAGGGGGWTWDYCEGGGCRGQGAGRCQTLSTHSATLLTLAQAVLQISPGHCYQHCPG